MSTTKINISNRKIIAEIKMGLPTIKARILDLDTAPEYKKIFVR